MGIVRKYLPAGTRDLIFEEAASVRNLDNRLMNLYLTLGFRPIETPVLEYYDVFNHEKRYISEKSIFKLSDQEGRLVALRPDNTSPVIRVVLSKLKDADYPLKICYSQPIFRNHIAFHAKKSQILQSGIEIIGGNKQEEDLRCLFTSLACLRMCGSDYKLEIGNARFFDTLVAGFSITEQERNDLRTLMAAKNSGGYSFALNMTNPIVLKLARELPRMCGSPRQVLTRARALVQDNRDSLSILDELETVCSTFSGTEFEDKIILDLGIVQKINYYTGLVFRGYVSGIGEAVLSGGRYDDLMQSFGADLSACGFGINVSDLSELCRTPIPRVPDLSFCEGQNSIKNALDYLNGIQGDTSC